MAVYWRTSQGIGKKIRKLAKNNATLNGTCQGTNLLLLMHLMHLIDLIDLLGIDIEQRLKNDCAKSKSMERTMSSRILESIKNALIICA